MVCIQAFQCLLCIPEASRCIRMRCIRDEYKGMKLVYEGPITALRHFTAGFELL